MGKKSSLNLVPFHESILAEMEKINPDVKDGKARAVALATLLGKTKCPERQKDILSAFQAMVHRFGGPKNRRFNNHDRAQFGAASRALCFQLDESSESEGSSSSRNGANGSSPSAPESHAQQ